MPDIVNEIISNKILTTAVVSWFSAQSIKIILAFFKTGKLDLRLIMSSGGMPSSHTAFVVAMAVAVGLDRGFDTIYFAIASVLSMVVMYDATGVRREAGKQAAAINIVVKHLGEQVIKLDKALKELLGHRPIEVFFGFLLGIIVAMLLN